MATVLDKKFTVDEYLDREQASARKSEYVDGEIREMTGASRIHGLLGFRIAGLLFRTLDSERFETFLNDMRVRAGEDGPYYYPDIVIATAPSKIDKHRGETLLNPLVIFEILSPSTEGIDRGEKLANYGRIGSLSDYVLVSQDEMRIDHFSRQSDGSWRLLIHRAADQVLSIPAIKVDLLINEVYAKLLEKLHEG